MRFWFAVALSGFVGVTGCGGGSEDDDESDGTQVDADGGDDGTPDSDGGDDGFDAMPDAMVPMGLHSLSTGDLLTCDLNPAGSAFCWGQLETEVLADTQVHTTPAAFGGTLKFTQITAAGRNVCGVDTTSMGYCWGPDGGAQFGTGAQTNGDLAPVLVGTGRPFAKLFAGDETACGIGTNGIGYCWGVTNYGQVGADVTGGNGVQSPVAIFGGRHWLKLSTSQDFVCGVTTAHELYCWGSDQYGAVGNGGAITNNHDNDVDKPAQVDAGHEWATVAAGDHAACALTTAGAAFCWGTSTTNTSPAPVAVPGGQVFNSIDLGTDFACGLTAVGEAYCWGVNTLGQLGSGDTNPVTMPTHVAAGLTFSEISAGDSHACGATLDNTKVYCWGKNDKGQLGSGSLDTDPHATPAQVTQTP